MASHRRLAAATAKLTLAGALLLLCCCNRPVYAQVQGQGDVIPYLLVANSRCIYRMELNGTRVDRLLCDRFAGIMALDYHYRKGYMFWTNVNDHTIKRAKLDGSNVTKIVETGLQYPAGLAVDWINDKLYWTDRDEREIQVIDLTTGEKSTVLVCDPKSRTLGLAVYPFQGSGILYWGDPGERAILSVPIGTTQREVSQRTNCPWPVTIDPLTQTIVWSDYCGFNIQSVFLNSTNPIDVLPGRVHQVHFSYGVALFQESLFWTQQEFVYSINRRGNISLTQVFSIRDTVGGTAESSQTILYGIKAVHPFRQPTADQLAGLSLCYARGCFNGICQPSGQCSCYPGWAGQSCSISSEVDECAVSNGNCQHQCINLVGSYECACNMGFSLDSNQRNCTDVDECADSNGGCEHQCNNLAGSYECLCNEGFSLDSNRRNCSDTDECSESNGGCEHQCINLAGSYECSCNEGFILSSDERNCLDIDECSESTGGCEHQCINLAGSYECSCNEGFILSSDERNCLDIDECSESTGGCEHQCINLAGSYECSCNEGFILSSDERNCLDVDECTVSNGGCEQQCTNLVGSYECSCNEGFTLGDDERNCTDVNECAVLNGGCAQLCTNVVGGHVCSCIEGFQASGKSCIATEISPSPTVSSKELTSTGIHVVHVTIHTPGNDPRTVTVPVLAQSPTPSSEDTLNTKTVSRMTPSPLPPEIDSVRENDGKNTLIMIIVTVTVGAALLIGAAVCYAVILYCKYRGRKRGSWTPKHFERNSNPQRTSFKRISESDSTSTPSTPENTPVHSQSALEQQALHSSSTVDTLSFHWGD